MTGPETSPDDERAPISWETLAAELAATREETVGRPDADPTVWDAVAAELAARVAERPPPPDAGPAPLPEEPEPPAAAAGPRPEPEPEALFELPAPPEPEPDPAELRGGLEALLFVADGPVDEVTLADALRCPPGRVRAALTGLAADYDARRAGITLRRVGDGWRLYTREEFAPVVERHLADGQRTRLTQAALETLAVIAYRQPVTRARVSAIRGVGVDGVMRTLLARGLVAEVGTDPDSGGGLYGTTPLFLERLGLTGLDELPPLAPLLPDAAGVAAESFPEG
ncbi:segregation and condensation protein B [Geodermatophilus bullaregiensis]|uniref:SMC-Scp complex subunit ScpB n=1 Tax=Geodermatophilus bullaregiensis TaxID=1564160 RepID=UPI00195B1E47|nr:SMC-Scp complex subunit ScpB [Geodermatophilus bullaregiensis]MBM7804529.1 segregation and condensation protein B [Geodermatophilus bullaregiensis]